MKRILAFLAAGSVYLVEPCRCAEYTAASSKSEISILVNDARRGYVGALLKLGVLNDPSTIPFLKRCTNGDVDNCNPREACQALARMRVDGYYAVVIGECRKALSLPNDANGSWSRVLAFRTLAYVGGSDAIALCAEALFDNTDPPQSRGVIRTPNRVMAAEVLATLMSDGPTKRPIEDEDVAQWRAWWRARKPESSRKE
jgi:hypothetical protein